LYNRIERKPITPHLLRYQGLVVDDYDFALDALDLGHPRLSPGWDKMDINSI
jgi:hypothetical protein